MIQIHRFYLSFILSLCTSVGHAGSQKKTSSCSTQLSAKIQQQLSAQREKVRASIKKEFFAPVKKSLQSPKKQTHKKGSPKKRHRSKRKKYPRTPNITNMSPQTVQQMSRPVATTESPGQQRLRKLRDIIDQLVRQTDKKASVGIKVVLLKNNCTVYEKNAHQQFIPASNTKLITAAAAYHLLSPDYTFTTKLFTDKKLSPHRINNLYIQGGGDPTLSESDLGTLVRTLKKNGIREIKGDLIVDATIFNQKGTGPGWRYGDASLYDKAPTSGLMVNHSCIRVSVKPGASGQPPTVILDPQTRFYRVINKARTVSKREGTGLHVLRGQGNAIIVKGTISRRSKPKYYRIAVEYPHLYAAAVLESELRRNKLFLRGIVKIGVVPSSATLLAEHKSSKLSTIVRTMMKASDNLYADAIFRIMGAHMLGAPGTWDKGKQVVTQFLQENIGLSGETTIINDGSGLSHTNQVSPDDLFKLLEWMYTTSPHKESFIASLPIGGVDGTLRNRMKHRPVKASVQAKTGSLTGVTSLSGYITPKTGLPLIFVIMVNRSNKSAVLYKRQLEDQLCRLLAAHAFSTY